MDDDDDDHDPFDISYAGVSDTGVSDTSRPLVKTRTNPQRLYDDLIDSIYKTAGFPKCYQRLIHTLEKKDPTLEREARTLELQVSTLEREKMKNMIFNNLPRFVRLVLMERRSQPFYNFLKKVSLQKVDKRDVSYELIMGMKKFFNQLLKESSNPYRVSNEYRLAQVILPHATQHQGTFGAVIQEYINRYNDDQLRYVSYRIQDVGLDRL